MKSMDPAMKTMNYALIKAEQKIRVLVLYNCPFSHALARSPSLQEWKYR